MKKNTVLFFALACFGFNLTKAQYTLLHSFNDTVGKAPRGSLSLSGRMLYGTTSAGGTNNEGCIFRIDTNGNNYKDLLDFNGTNGNYPGFTQFVISNGMLYGTTETGGTYDWGCVFAVDSDGTRFKDLHDFDSIHGKMPEGPLSLTAGVLYGMTAEGGTNNNGCIFSIDTNGNNFKDLFHFNYTDGAIPNGGLTLLGKTMYGMTWDGGSPYWGVVFAIDTDGSNFRDLVLFHGSNEGKLPAGDITIVGRRLFGMTSSGGMRGWGSIFSIDTDGSDYTQVLSFNDTNGYSPLGSLILSGNKLFGMTESVSGYYGNVFSIDTSGSAFKNLISFNNTLYPEGAQPYGSLILSGTALYGMTPNGGAFNDGVIFKLDTNGSITSGWQLSVINDRWSVFPNPSNGIFIIQTSNIEQGILNFEVYNVLGEKVYKETLRRTQGDKVINLTEQPNGIYFYRVLNEDGTVLGNGKLFIQK